jgi:hypothetical protein
VGASNADNFTYQARAFLDQVAGVTEPLPREGGGTKGKTTHATRPNARQAPFWRQDRPSAGGFRW